MAYLLIALCTSRRRRLGARSSQKPSACKSWCWRTHSSSGKKQCQLDDNEVEVISRTILEECYRNFTEVTGSDPVPEADPTLEQITPMRAKIIERGESPCPCAGFSVLVPFGRENQKLVTWRIALSGGGHPRTTILCGLATMLEGVSHCAVDAEAQPVHPHAAKPVITIAALEGYADKTYELCNEFPEC